MRNSTFHLHATLVAVAVLFAIAALSVERFGWLTEANPVLGTLLFTAWVPIVVGVYSFRYPRGMFVTASDGAKTPTSWAYGHWVIFGSCGLWVFMELLLNPVNPRLYGVVIVMISLGMNAGDFVSYQRDGD